MEQKPEYIKQNHFWAGVILYNPVADSVLMQKRDDQADVNPGLWGFFGGVRENEETPKECIVREVKEEIGVILDQKSLRPLTDYLHRKQMIWRYTFTSHFSNPKSDMILKEGEDFDWVGCDSVLSYPLTANTRKDIELFLRLKGRVPKFIAQLGQTDYRNIRWAPVINCVVMFQEKILLVKRSEQLNFYPGYWNGISGFLDDDKSLEEKVHEELREELGLGTKHILSLNPGQVFDQDEPKYKKTWIVHPVLVEIDTDQIRTDWESESYAWMTVAEARKQKLLPGFENVLQALGLSAQRFS